MKRWHRSLIALPTLLLMPHEAAAKPLAPFDPIRLAAVTPALPADWRPDIGAEAEPAAFLAPLNPEALPHHRQAPDADQPAIREKEAILPDPLNGRVLVDRTVALAGAGRPIPVQVSPAPRLHRVYQHWWLGPNFVLPVAKGG
jgi:hypothetical protein